MSQERAEMLASDLATEGWGNEELLTAARIIASDPEIAKEVRFAGTIAPYHFTLARERMNERPSLGNCFHFRDGYGCRQPASIRAFGDIYCPSCFERHMGEIPNHRLDKFPKENEELRRIRTAEFLKQNQFELPEREEHRQLRQ